FFFQAEDGIRDRNVTGVQTCALPISLNQVGVEPFDNAFNGDYFFNICQGRKIFIKSFLLHQEIVAGVGNIYASEICFFAGVDPRKMACDISKEEANRIVDLTKKVMENAIKMCGTTFQSFHSVNGIFGAYVNELKVYHREDKPCFNCETPITRIVQNGRSTFYCGKCQK